MPAFFNGMATAADWISAASFISLAGGLYLQGFDGLAFIMGWTGGFCLVALLIAPYLRKFGQYTIPDFLAARYSGRYGGHWVRVLAVLATIIVSFTYVVAQIYGVGLITSRFTGVDFSVGIFLGLASILVCSFLGGMRAITWTQVAQYIVLLIAYLIPVIWLSVKHTGIPVPQVAYGAVLPKLAERERQLSADPGEQQVRAVFRQRADEYEIKLKNLPQSWQDGLAQEQREIERLRTGNASLIEIRPPTARWPPIRRPRPRPSRPGPRRAPPTWRAPSRRCRRRRRSRARTRRPPTSSATTSWRWCSA